MHLVCDASHQMSICLSVSEGLVIHDDWNFTLSAFSPSVAAAVVTATGDSYTAALRAKACFSERRPKPSTANSSYPRMDVCWASELSHCFRSSTFQLVICCALADQCHHRPFCPWAATKMLSFMIFAFLCISALNIFYGVQVAVLFLVPWWLMLMSAIFDSYWVISMSIEERHVGEQDALRSWFVSALAQRY